MDSKCDAQQDTCLGFVNQSLEHYLLKLRAVCDAELDTTVVRLAPLLQKKHKVPVT